MIVEGQVHGGVAQGIGQALLEQCVYDEESGQLLTGSFMDYAMPRADDLPSFKVGTNGHAVHAQSARRQGLRRGGRDRRAGRRDERGARRAGAVGVKHLDMPASPHRVWQAIQPQAAPEESNMYAFELSAARRALADAAAALAKTRRQGARRRAEPRRRDEAAARAAGHARRSVGASPISRASRKDGDGISIGAMTRHAEVADVDGREAAIPALASLADGIGDRQVRNMGTIGGSIANNDPGGVLSGGGRRARRDDSHQHAHRSPPTISSRACTRRRSSRARSSWR